MRKTAIFLLLLTLLFALSACDQEQLDVSSSSDPTSSQTNPTFNKPTIECQTHEFTEDPLVCSVCGIDYFSATLEFTLSDTGDSYIVSDVGTCAASEIVIPATYKGLSVTQIGECAFGRDIFNLDKHSSRHNITQVTIPSSVQIIGYNAFHDCRSLKKVIDAGGVTVIDRAAFHDCKALESITLPETLTTIGDFAFDGTTALKAIDIPRGVTSIGVFALANSGITRLELSMDAATIEGYLVRECDSLEEIRISGGITEIPEYFAANCDSLKTVELGENIIGIGQYAFERCTALKNIQLGSKLESIGQYVFLGCTSLQTISLPNSLKHLSGGVFYNCPIETIEIPNKLESVDELQSFIKCDRLKYHEYKGMGYVGSQQNPYMILVCQLDPTVKHVEVHKNTRFIQDGMLLNTEVTSLTLGESVEMFPITKILKARKESDRMIKVDVVPESKNFHMVNGCLIETASKTLVMAFENFAIPDDGSVTAIGNMAFACVSCPKTLIIPDAIESIGINAFLDCTGLEQFVIGRGVKEIGHDAFWTSGDFSVFYMGSAEDWKELEELTDGFFMNELLASSPRYYYSETTPTEEGNYWHYVDGKPTPWPVLLPTSEE